MGNGIIGKILYFWIFVLGGCFVAKVLGFADNDRSMIVFFVALALFYIVWNVARSLGRKKKENSDAQNVQPVRKGNSHKKKKR